MPSDSVIELNHTQPPGFFAIYRRLLFGKRARYEKGAPLPHFRATWKGAQANPDKVKRYCDACGLTDDGHYPILYPHILTSPIHLHMMSLPQFPLSPMGAVHARNHLIRHAPIPVETALDITCELTTTRIVKQGVEFEVTTTLEAGGTRYWESISAYLIRGKKFGEPGEPSERADMPPLEGETESFTWEVPRDMGWRYARITGDFNPIHVSRILAKFMGFDRDLIHGMWSAARCTSHLAAPDSSRPVQLDLIFKGPVYMESTSTMHAGAAGNGTQFDLFCDDNPRPCIRGRIQPADPETRLTA